MYVNDMFVMYVNDMFVINENSRSRRHFTLVQPHFKPRRYGFKSHRYQATTVVIFGICLRGNIIIDNFYKAPTTLGQ